MKLLEHREDLLTTDELAELLRLTPEATTRLRRKHDWPFVRLTRFDIRFTPDQAREIVARHTVTPVGGLEGTPEASGPLTGQTARSAARAS